MPLPPPPLLRRHRLPLLGHTHIISGLVGSPAPLLLQGYREHGPVFAVEFAGKHAAVLLSPQGHRLILERETEFLSWGAAYGEGGKRVLGENSLPILDGEEHRRRRSPMMPAFHHSRLVSYLDSMLRLTAEQTAQWAQRGRIALLPEFSELTFRVACTTLFGVSEIDDYPRFRQLYGRLFGSPLSVLGQVLGSPFLARDRLQLTQLVAPWLAARRAAPDRYTDVIAALVSAGLSDADILAQIMVLMLAGHDTTKSMLSFTLLLLLQHPAYLQRVLAEQRAVFPDGQITPERLRQLPLLERALRESNRMYPPAALLQRGVMADLEFGGYTIPKGWLVFYAPVAAHRLPEIFPAPDRFDPDRFAPPREEHKQPYALVDFGGGYRICIGKEFALFEGKAVLSHLLQHFDFAACSGEVIRANYAGFLTKPHPGQAVRVSRRSDRS